MIILKDKGVVYLAIGASSEMFCGYLSEKDDNLPENYLVWRVPNDDGIIACAAGSGFEANIFRYDSNLITGELTKEKLVLETVPKMKAVLKHFGKVDESGCSVVEFAFAQKDKAFVIFTDFCVMEVQAYEAVGDHEGRGLAALHITGDMAPEDRILFAQHMMWKTSDPRMAVIDTRSLVSRTIRNKRIG